jgi:hypothetical protein
MSSICIIDPASHIPGLKYLFPESDYFSHEPDNFFTYISTPHYTKKQLLEEYGFEYRTDWSVINDKQYKIIMLVAPLMDYFNPLSPSMIPHMKRMLSLLSSILTNNKFNKVLLFDMYDYDYDPNDINDTLPIQYYFKRNYNSKKQYKSNVFPFPCSMFVKPCVLTTMLQKNLYNQDFKYHAPMWAGGVYTHVDTNYNPPIVRDRKAIFEKIKDKLIVYSGLSIQDYIKAIRHHSIVVDLLGVGDPNKRTFEAFANGTLVMSMIKDLNWGFEDGDRFHPDTIFTTSEEYEEKLTKLLKDRSHYDACLRIQNTLVEKYFTKEKLRTYILNKIGE